MLFVILTQGRGLDFSKVLRDVEWVFSGVGTVFCLKQISRTWLV